MKVQEVISSCIMFIVSGLVLVGFTIAWFTNAEFVTVTGLEVQAVELGHVRVALTPGGPDISDLAADEATYGAGAQYADVCITESPGADTETQTDSEGRETQVPTEFAPGAYGSVTFYVTPVNNSPVKACEIVPMLQITQDNGNTWYPEVEDDGADPADGAPALEELYALAGKHIKFFKDADMTQPLDADTLLLLTWNADGSIGADSEGTATEAPNVGDGGTDEGTDPDAHLLGQEQKAVIYWKWYYEYYEGYPLTPEEAAIYTTEKQKIRKYDEEDMQLGNNITNMRFYITFSAR